MNRAPGENQVPRVECGACGGQRLQLKADIALYLPDGLIPDSIWRCRFCGSYTRLADYDDPTVRRHFEITSYTPLENEARTRADRGPFLDYISRLSASYVGRPLAGEQTLDVGATYGILADLFTGQRAVCSVVEIVGYLRDELNRRGYEAYASVGEVPPDRMFDIITAIDSLYYVQEPAAILRRLHGHLADDGILVIRVTNRTPYLRLLRLLGLPITSDFFGDAKHAFTRKGIYLLLKRSGFRIRKIVLRERGKHPENLKLRIVYRATAMLSMLPGVTLTPGMILICSRE